LQIHQWFFHNDDFQKFTQKKKKLIEIKMRQFFFGKEDKKN
jgi:hypothetical protein